MSAFLQLPNLDQIVAKHLPALLGSYEDPDEQVIVPQDANIGAAFEGLADDITELGAVMKAGQPINLTLLNRARGRLTAINSAVQRQPQIAQQLGPMARIIPATRTLLDAAGNTALQLRTRDTYNKLSRPNNQTSIHILQLADGSSSPKFTVKAPVNGRPFRLLGFTAEVATVGSDTVAPSREVIGVGISSFDFGGTERVKNDNVSVDSGSLATAKWDLSQFSKGNLDDDNATKLYPWGIGPTGFFESDFTFSFKVNNACGRTVNIVITLYWQASPCDDEVNGRGLYRAGAIPIQDPRTAQALARVIGVTSHPMRV